MSILMDSLMEEYERLEREEIVFKEAADNLVKGYISKKIIRGNPSYYLQWRESGKIVSKYISKKDLPVIEEEIRKRKVYEKALCRVAEDKRRLRKVLDIK